MFGQKSQIMDQNGALENIIDGQLPKLDRADKFHTKNLKKVEAENPEQIENSKQYIQANLDQQRNLTKTFYSVIQ
jgi:hypothetical protein